MWPCQHCQYDIDEELTHCWRCGRDRVGNVDSGFEPAVQPSKASLVCKQCDYPLRGLTGDRCPECGETFDAYHVDTPPAPPIASNSHRWGWLWWTPFIWLLAFGLTTWATRLEDMRLPPWYSQWVDNVGSAFIFLSVAWVPYCVAMALWPRSRDND